LGLVDNLVLGYPGPWWSSEEVALLGVLTDDEVAQRTGRTPAAVRQKREELGIKNPAASAKVRWTADEVALLGTLADGEVARRLGRSLSSVLQKRTKLGLPRAR
jgi:hypothetical protein